VVPQQGDVLEQGKISFRWSRGTNNATVLSSLEITETESGAVVYCEDRPSLNDSREVTLPPGKYSWTITNGGPYVGGSWFRVTSNSQDFEIVEDLPNSYALLQNYPNPFNPTTTIRFNLPTTSLVRLVIYSVTGEEIARLVDERLPAGYHEFVFGSEAASGLYLYRLEAIPLGQPSQRFVDVKKMMLLR